MLEQSLFALRVLPWTQIIVTNILPANALRLND
jgi:hypothetical protein